MIATNYIPMNKFSTMNHTHVNDNKWVNSKSDKWNFYRVWLKFPQNTYQLYKRKAEMCHLSQVIKVKISNWTNQNLQPDRMHWEEQSMTSMLFLHNLNPIIRKHQRNPI